MALTATATQGLEFHRYVAEHEVLYVPGDPGDTYTRGDAVVATVGEGVIDVAADSEVAIGTVAKTTVCPAATTAFPKPADFYPAFDSDAGKALIPIHSAVPAGTPVYLATFAGHIDEVVVSYDAATPYFEGTTGAGADDRPNGAFVYVYEGPGIGEVNLVADYDHAGGAVDKLYTLHRTFSATLTTSSKLIVLAGEAAASRGIGAFGRIDLQDQNNLHTADGANDGIFVVYMDWRRAAEYLKNLTLPVVRASALHMV